MNAIPFSLGDLRKTWAKLAQFAIWATAIVATFLLTPPRKTPALDETTWVRFAQFVLVIALGLSIALLSRNQKRRSLCVSASIGFLTLGLAGFFTNLVVTDEWTCAYDGRGPMVIGKSTTLIANEHLRLHPGMSCTELIQDFVGNTAEIWAQSEISERHAILVGLYLANVLSFSLSMLFMLEGLRAPVPRRK